MRKNTSGRGKVKRRILSEATFQRRVEWGGEQASFLEDKLSPGAGGERVDTGGHVLSNIKGNEIVVCEPRAQAQRQNGLLTVEDDSTVSCSSKFRLE